MENENIEKENKGQLKITTPVAIIIAGFLIMIGILLTYNKSGNQPVVEKTLSEQVGISKDKFAQCMEEIDVTLLAERIQTSVDKAMINVPADQRGTPYSVIIGANGVKTEVRGAYPYENVMALIDEVISGNVTDAYTGEIVTYEEGDHIIGNPNAPIVIVEYSDFQCPYCKIFHQTMKRIVAESDGSVAWVYRHWPIQSSSFEKAVASECVASIKGNEAFWAYTDLLFDLIKTSADPVVNNL
jgi:predicted DsbA family dithiol-disulfide isomerase